MRAAADVGPGYFEQLVTKADSHKSEANDDISRDLGRSMPDIALIACSEGQQRLRRCLTAYALHNADVGYCQGMNFIAAVLQLHLPEEEDAFWCLDVIVKKIIPGGLSRALTGFKISVLVLCDLAKTLLPDCYLELEGLGIPVEDVLGMICPQWFISLFVNALPLGLVFKFWDVIWLEGSIAVYQLGLAILESFAHHLESSGQPFPAMAPGKSSGVGDRVLVCLDTRSPWIQECVCARVYARVAHTMTHTCVITSVWLGPCHPHLNLSPPDTLPLSPLQPCQFPPRCAPGPPQSLSHLILPV